LGQGRDAVKQLIEDNPELAEELEGKIKAILSKVELPTEAPSDEATA
jgi:recombination protein RecA